MSEYIFVFFWLYAPYHGVGFFLFFQEDNPNQSKWCDDVFVQVFIMILKLNFLKLLLFFFVIVVDCHSTKFDSN